MVEYDPKQSDRSVQFTFIWRDMVLWKFRLCLFRISAIHKEMKNKRIYLDTSRRSQGSIFPSKIFWPTETIISFEFYRSGPEVPSVKLLIAQYKCWETRQYISHFKNLQKWDFVIWIRGPHPAISWYYWFIINERLHNFIRLESVCSCFTLLLSCIRKESFRNLSWLSKRVARLRLSVSKSADLPYFKTCKLECTFPYKNSKKFKKYQNINYKWNVWQEMYPARNITLIKSH